MSMKMKQMMLFFTMVFIIPSLTWAESCVECHRQTTPSIVTDWLASKHSSQGVDCKECHGSGHNSKEDVAKAKRPLPETCGTCHNKAAQTVQARKTLTGLGGDQDPAAHPSAAHVSGVGDQGLRGLPQARHQDR